MDKFFKMFGFDKLSKVLEHINAPDKFMRRQAAEALAHYKEEEATKALLEMINDPCGEVRYAAARALKSHIIPNDPETRSRFYIALRDFESAQTLGKVAFNAFKLALRDEDEEIRSRAAKTLVSMGPEAVNILIDTLADEDDDIRDCAAEAIRSLGAPAIPFLIRSLSREEENLKQTATIIIKQFGDRAVIPLIRALKHDDPNVRERMATVLGELSDQRALSALIEAVDDPDMKVKRAIIKAIGELGDPESIPVLLTEFVNAERLYFEIYWAMTRVGEGIVEPVIDLMQKESWEVRKRAAALLGDLGDLRAIEHLKFALNDEHWTVRCFAALSLGDIGEPETYYDLLPLLNDMEPRVRASAAYAMGKLGNKEAIDTLNMILYDIRENEFVLFSASCALLLMGDTAGIDTVAQALENKDLREMAIQIIGLSRQEEPIERVVEALKGSSVATVVFQDRRKWPAYLQIEQANEWLLLINDAYKAKCLIGMLPSVLFENLIEEALVNINNPKAIDPLVETLGAIYVNKLKIHSMRILGRLKFDKTIEPLLNMLNNEVWELRRSAALALGSLGERSGDYSKEIPKLPIAEESLIQALDDDNRHVRSAAAISLGRLRSSKAVEPLIILLNDNRYQVRRSAAWALGQIRNHKARPSLLNAMKERDRRTKIHIAGALCKLGEIEASDILIESLFSADLTLRLDSVMLLKEIEEDWTTDHLISALPDKRWEVRLQVIKALGRIKDTVSSETKSKIITALTKLLFDTNIAVRLATLDTLVEIGGIQTIPIIEPFTESTHRQTRITARRKIENLQGGTRQVH